MEPARTLIGLPLVVPICFNGTAAVRPTTKSREISADPRAGRLSRMVRLSTQAENRHIRSRDWYSVPGTGGGSGTRLFVGQSRPDPPFLLAPGSKYTVTTDRVPVLLGGKLFDAWPCT